MQDLNNTSFVIVDVETTGSDPKNNRIFDICCIRYENNQIIDVFNSLVNPHQFIPPYVSKLTGISNKKVYFAPEPNEVFKNVYNFINSKPSIFVAHNANFDFSFIQNALDNYNLKLNLPVLCTLKLSRKLLPRELKKNVGSLADYFYHSIENRHRAYDDSFATVTILKELIELAKTDFDINTIDELLIFQNKPVRFTKIKSPNIDYIIEQIKEIPNEAGNFKILNKNDEVIFADEVNLLQNRLLSYFGYGEHQSKKIIQIIKNAYKIEWELKNQNLRKDINSIFEYLVDRIKL